MESNVNPLWVCLPAPVCGLGQGRTALHPARLPGEGRGWSTQLGRHRAAGSRSHRVWAGHHHRRGYEGLGCQRAPGTASRCENKGRGASEAGRGSCRSRLGRKLRPGTGKGPALRGDRGHAGASTPQGEVLVLLRGALLGRRPHAGALPLPPGPGQSWGLRVGTTQGWSRAHRNQYSRTGGRLGRPTSWGPLGPDRSAQRVAG